MTLTEFLTARINEHEHGLNLMREAVIRAGEQWATLPQAGRDVVSAHLVMLGLADCEAKRRIVEHHEYGMGYRARAWGDGVDAVYEVCGACYERDEHGYASNAKAPCTTLRLLALPYADHPDYQETWRP